MLDLKFWHLTRCPNPMMRSDTDVSFHFTMRRATLCILSQNKYISCHSRRSGFSSMKAYKIGTFFMCRVEFGNKRPRVRSMREWPPCPRQHPIEDSFEKYQIGLLVLHPSNGSSCQTAQISKNTSFAMAGDMQGVSLCLRVLIEALRERSLSWCLEPEAQTSEIQKRNGMTIRQR
jgi:hypothetical protein